MLRFVLAPFVFAAAILPLESQAAPIRCDTCIRGDDFRMAAQAHGPGTHIVFNLGNGQMETWRIPGGHTGAGEPDSIRSSNATRTANNPDAQLELDKAHELYVIGGNTLRPIYHAPVHALNLPAAQGKTAHDVVRDNNLRAQLESAASDAVFLRPLVEKDWEVAVLEFLGIGTAYLDLRSEVGALLRVSFSDGSHVDVEANIDDTVGSVLMETARTAAGQHIPADGSRTGS